MSSLKLTSLQIEILCWITSDFASTKHTFFRVIRYYKSYQYLKSLTSIKVKLENDPDQVQLVEIFTRLGMDPTQLHESLLTTKWIDIGFQGEDPTTDFRGTGKLGLLNFYHFVTHNESKARQCLKHAKDKKTEYFLACSGINVTFHLMNRFDEPTILNNFAMVTSEEEVLGIFNGIYTSAVQKLDEYWIKSPLSSSFMNFNQVVVSS